MVVSINKRNKKIEKLQELRILGSGRLGPSKKFEKGLAILFIPVVFIISELFLHSLVKLLMTV